MYHSIPLRWCQSQKCTSFCFCGNEIKWHFCNNLCSQVVPAFWAPMPRNFNWKSVSFHVPWCNDGKWGIEWEWFTEVNADEVLLVGRGLFRNWVELEVADDFFGAAADAAEEAFCLKELKRDAKSLMSSVVYLYCCSCRIFDSDSCRFLSFFLFS